jgi:RNA-directed DNA polymerase
MRTARKKFKAAIANLLSWIKAERSKLGTRSIFMKLRQKLQGHWNYYGVSGNFEMLWKYYHQALEIMFKWLNRRSQRKSCTWGRFMEIVKYFGIPRPRIIGYWD